MTLADGFAGVLDFELKISCMMLGLAGVSVDVVEVVKAAVATLSFGSEDFAGGTVPVNTYSR